VGRVVVGFTGEAVACFSVVHAIDEQARKRRRQEA
jgi:hypothetical protein